MSTFSKFLNGFRGCKQVLDSDGYIYSRKKNDDTVLSSAWRCQKNKSLKCPGKCYLALTDNTLSLGSKPHNHDSDLATPQRLELLTTLKRKAAEQPLSATQNLISEVLADASTEVNQTLPNMESLGKVVQRARASASGSAQHTESKTSLEFVLPPSCTSTRRDEQFILFDGKTDRDVRIIAFATNRNLHALAEHNNWIADGTFYVAPKIFPQSYTIHSKIENKCLPLVYILTGDKKGDTYSYVLSVIKYFFDQNCPTDTGTVLIDFEKAVMNSFRDILPGWKVANCYFHLCQSVQKNISKKFKVRYFKDPSESPKALCSRVFSCY